MKAHVKGSGGEAYPDAGGTVSGNRVVRALRGTVSPSKSDLHENFHGQPYFATLWPVAPGPVPPAPWDDPDCALREWVWMKRGANNNLRVVGVPSIAISGSWVVPTSKSGRYFGGINLSDLTPVEEPCEHDGYHEMRKDGGGMYVVCSNCGEVLSDRRVTVRRAGERRKIGDRYQGGRRVHFNGATSQHERRKAQADRRRAKP